MVSTWDASLETGNAEIDDQHRQLIELMDEFIEVDDRAPFEVFNMLDKIMEFTNIHFLMEEELMAQVGYPADAAEEMKEQHWEFKAYSRLRFLEFRHGEILGIHSYRTFLDNWLKIHEFGLDRKLADWIRQQRAGAA